MKSAKHDHAAHKWSPNSTTLPVGRFDLDRMKDAVAQPQIMAPRGMSIEQMRKFIISGGKSR